MISVIFPNSVNNLFKKKLQIFNVNFHMIFLGIITA